MAESRLWEGPLEVAVIHRLGGSHSLSRRQRTTAAVRCLPCARSLDALWLADASAVRPMMRAMTRGLTCWPTGAPATGEANWLSESFVKRCHLALITAKEVRCGA